MQTATLTRVELENLVLSRIQEVQNQLAEKGFAKFDIEVIIKRINGRIAGQAFLSADRIHISEDYLRDCTDDVIATTVPHEVCHLYVNKYFPRAKQHHGPEFRSLMRSIGCEGSTYHSMKLSHETKNLLTKTKTRYVYLTAITGREVFLTPNQHSHMVKGTRRYSYAGEPIAYSNEVRKFK